MSLKPDDNWKVVSEKSLPMAAFRARARAREKSYINKDTVTIGRLP